MPFNIFSRLATTIRFIARVSFASPCYDHRTDAMHAYLAEHQSSTDAADLAGAARRAFDSVPGIEIDPCETQWRHGLEGIQVRAWCLVSSYRSGHAPLPSAAMMREVGRLPELSRLILILRLRHGMSTAQISSRFGISRRSIRRHLARAVHAASSADDCA